jgi:hypothetical protein
VSDIVDAICRTKVKAKTLQRAVAVLAELDVEDRDFEGRVIAIIRALNEDGSDRSQPHLAAAIEFRLEAFARLSQRPELKAWSLPGDVEGMMHVQHVVWKAVAAEPLRVEGNRPAFDADSFFRRLTALSDAAGRG